jgi:hypothetical protein
VSDEARAALEARGHLRNAEPTDDRTWAYRADPDHFDALRAVLNDPAVEDVAGIDRKSMRLAEWGAATRLAFRSVGLDHLVLGPPVVSALSQPTLSALLFYLCWSMPAAAFALWWLRPRRNTGGPAGVAPDALIRHSAV